MLRWIFRPIVGIFLIGLAVVILMIVGFVRWADRDPVAVVPPTATAVAPKPTATPLVNVEIDAPSMQEVQAYVDQARLEMQNDLQTFQENLLKEVAKLQQPVPAPTLVPTSQPQPTLVAAVAPTRDLTVEPVQAMLKEQEPLNIPVATPLTIQVEGTQLANATFSQTGAPTVQQETFVFSTQYMSFPQNQYPSAPFFGDGDIVDLANRMLPEVGPKRVVYPRVLQGGCYNDAHNRDAFEQAVLSAAQELFGTQDYWSVFSFPGGNGENGAWFYSLTVESDNLTTISSGFYEHTIHAGQRQVLSLPVLQLDAMMAVNLVNLDQVGIRHLTKQPGTLSFVLCDGETAGSFSVALAVPPQFKQNFTAGDQGTVPAAIINGMPSAPVSVMYFENGGELLKMVSAEVESVNGTVTIEVPSDGNYVVISMPVRGSNPNANTEVLLRMGSQQWNDTPGKNWVPYSGTQSGGGK